MRVDAPFAPSTIVADVRPEKRRRPIPTYARSEKEGCVRLVCPPRTGDRFSARGTRKPRTLAMQPQKDVTVVREHRPERLWTQAPVEPMGLLGAESFLPIRLYGIVDPHLNRACVKAIVVVVAAAVLAAVAYVGYESLGCAAGPRIQENATA